LTSTIVWYADRLGAGSAPGTGGWTTGYGMAGWTLSGVRRGSRLKIYTRRGDGGETGIWGGKRLPKDHLRIEVIGSVDECNAAIGVAVAEGVTDRVAGTVADVQSDLFVLGSDLIGPSSGRQMPTNADRQ
jgi:hypothetical protein